MHHPTSEASLQLGLLFHQLGALFSKFLGGFISSDDAAYVEHKVGSIILLSMELGFKSLGAAHNFQ